MAYHYYNRILILNNWRNRIASKILSLLKLNMAHATRQVASRRTVYTVLFSSPVISMLSWPTMRVFVPIFHVIWISFKTNSGLKWKWIVLYIVERFLKFHFHWVLAPFLPTNCRYFRHWGLCVLAAGVICIYESEK